MAEPRVAVIGAPLDLGADRRGVDMGPSAIRYAGLDARLAELGYECVAGEVARARGQGRFPLVLGGDHSVALGTLGGLASVRGPGAVLWFDAHGDVNTPVTTPSGNVHGRPLGAALGLAGSAFMSVAWPLPALAPRRVSLIGTRPLRPGPPGA